MTTTKVKAAVLMGGISSEHKISLKTGVSVVNQLNKQKYEVIPIALSKYKKWLIYPDASEFTYHIIEDALSNKSLLSLPDFLDEFQKLEIDIVYIALHGMLGEDGVIQGLFEIMNVPYTGSGVAASALAMDKCRSQDICEFYGLKFPKYKSYNNKNKIDKIVKEVKDNFSMPVVLKPVDGGSSEATFIIKDEADIADMTAKAFEVTQNIMFQEYIKGDEVSCGVLGVNELQVLTPTQIIPLKGEFFDLEAKYVKGACDEVTPPRLPNEVIKKIQDNALKAHQILGCKGVSRTDMIISNNEIYVLETNTLPGMTETSLLPQAAAYDGIEFPELLDRIISYGFEA